MHHRLYIKDWCSFLTWKIKPRVSSLLPRRPTPYCLSRLLQGTDWVDYGGYLSTVNSLLRSRNQFETIWALWHDVLSYWKHSSEDGNTLVINRWTWAATVVRQAVAFKQFSISSKWPRKCTHTMNTWTVDTKHHEFVLSCCLCQIMTTTFFQSSMK